MQVQEFNHIIQGIKDKMYRLALRIVKDPEDARDVIQDAMIKIWTKRALLADVDNKEAYMMTMTRNVAIDKYRSRKIETTDIDNHFNIESKSAGPERQYVAKEAYNRVRKMIEALPENHRTVIHLRDIEGYTYKEISEMTGFTIGKVKVYLHRARTRLKEHFKNRVL
ncbi:MAG: sigma-70 family RNA polymerase sigma factor [Saprospiraceae bacterium]|nr:sigma-70 family RNA polymerase sigma factor [Bacteroidia bacterium]NNK89815.1 sigma-70 family RNA polymerase sigma factor [Saprospiraceae bacterium]